MKNYIILLFICLLLLTASCVPLHQQTTVNIPDFEEIGELEIAAYAGSNDADLNIAYRIDEDFGFLLNASHVSRSRDTFFNKRQNYGEFAMCYLLKDDIGKMRTSIFERIRTGKRFKLYPRKRTLCLGGGSGWSLSSNYIDDSPFNSRDRKDSVLSEGFFYKAFFQYNSSMDLGNFTSHSAIRVNYVNYNRFRGSLRQPLVRTRENGLVYIEMYFGHSFDIGNLELLYQAGLFIPIGVIDINSEFTPNPYMLNLGLRYNIYTLTDNTN